MGDTLLTAVEVGVMLKLSDETVRSWARQGHLPAVKVGTKAVRFRLSDVLDVMRPTGQTAGQG